MTYEYEKFILSLLTSLAIKKENKGYYVIADEVEDVYAKAKAFDAIVDIEDDFVKYHGFSPCVEEYAEEVEDIISEYEEEE